MLLQLVLPVGWLVSARHSTRLSSRCHGLSCAAPVTDELQSLYPEWPCSEDGKLELQPTLDAFSSLADVPRYTRPLTAELLPLSTAT